MRASNNAPLNSTCQCLSLRYAAPRYLRLQSRSISQAVLEKRKLARQQWAEKAKKIDSGEAQHLWDLFRERGYIKDVAG